MTDTIAVRVRVIRQETAKALQVVYFNGRIDWLPRSVIQGGEHRVAGERNAVLPVAVWFCEKEGIGERGPEREPQPQEQE